MSDEKEAKYVEISLMKLINKQANELDKMSILGIHSQCQKALGRANEAEEDNMELIRLKREIEHQLSLFKSMFDTSAAESAVLLETLKKLMRETAMLARALEESEVQTARSSGLAQSFRQCFVSAQRELSKLGTEPEIQAEGRLDRMISRELQLREILKKPQQVVIEQAPVPVPKKEKKLMEIE